MVKGMILFLKQLPQKSELATNRADSLWFLGQNVSKESNSTLPCAQKHLAKPMT